MINGKRIAIVLPAYNAEKVSRHKRCPVLGVTTEKLDRLSSRAFRFSDGTRTPICGLDWRLGQLL